MQVSWHNGVHERDSCPKGKGRTLTNPAKHFGKKNKFADRFIVTTTYVGTKNIQLINYKNIVFNHMHNGSPQLIFSVSIICLLIQKFSQYTHLSLTKYNT